ncbi:hypothetical protein [Streptomyces sp. NPDC097981]|uniref:hypothetical protein n=1 Tax=Streptomyces sp. NPDC097981 TaxID=3155428 RepID=UPI00331FF59D
MRQAKIRPRGITSRAAGTVAAICSGCSKKNLASATASWGPEGVVAAILQDTVPYCTSYYDRAWQKLLPKPIKAKAKGKPFTPVRGRKSQPMGARRAGTEAAGEMDDVAVAGGHGEFQ